MTVADARPLPATRRAELLERLGREGSVRVSDLVRDLGVTAVTVRRDIDQLAAEGLVVRVHGGATLARRPDPAATAGTAAAAGRRSEATPDAPAPAVTATRGTIGVVVPSLDYYWPGVVRGAEEEAGRHGLRILLRGSSYDEADERPLLERVAASEGTLGLLVAPNLDGPHSADVLAHLAAADLPVVLVERSAAVFSHQEPVESVVSDHALGAAVAVRHLADLGHRRIGLVLSRLSPTSRHVRAGWLQATTERGEEVVGTLDERMPDRGTAEFPGAIEHVVEACLATGTTALLVHSDPEAMAIVQRCEERGLSVPRDLSVIAYDDEVAGLFSPALTAVRPPRHAVGRAAVQLLADRLADPGRPVHRVVISPELQVRESTAPPPVPQSGRRP